MTYSGGNVVTTQDEIPSSDPEDPRNHWSQTKRFLHNRVQVSKPLTYKKIQMLDFQSLLSSYFLRLWVTGEKVEGEARRERRL